MPGVLSATTAALLGALHHGPQTGAQIFNFLGVLYGTSFGVSRTRIYHELPRLAEAGMVVPHGDPGPRGSQEHVITPVGKTMFKKWLTSEPESSQIRSEQLLRLFYARRLTPAQCPALFEHARNTYIDGRDRAIDAAKSEAPVAKQIARFRIAEAKAFLTLIDALERA